MRFSDHRIHCERCHALTNNFSEEGFTIEVPLEITSKTDRLTARIHCKIGNQIHQLSLEGLFNESGASMHLTNSEQNLIESIIKQLGDSRLCGNAKICPQRIVELVAELSKSTVQPD